MKTAECIHNLRGHTKDVTGVQFHPNNRMQVISCSLDKAIIFWDYSDGILLKRFTLDTPVYAMLNFPECNTKNMLFFLRKKGAVYDLVSQEIGSDKPPRILITNCRNDEHCIGAGFKGRFVACVTKHDLKINDLASRRNFRHHVQTNQSYFTCIACHPHDECLATGSSDGRIIIWKRFLRNRNVIKSINHWHALPVMDLSYSVEGTRLYSGGHECTLVIWQLNQHTRDFLPRIGAPIKSLSVSPDNQYVIASLADNEILVIEGSNRKIVQAIIGITVRQLGYQKTNPFPMGLHYDANNKALVTNGKPGHLQFYCLQTNKPLFNLDVVGLNYISPDKPNKQCSVQEVARASFNEDGTWLATVECWEMCGYDLEIKLKFWFYNSKEKKYILNTMIEMPHFQQVNSLCFCPLSPTPSINGRLQQIVTSSNDGKFKLWKLSDDTNAQSNWNCESEGFYRDFIPRQTSFAEDGSLLGVAFNYLITLWDPMTNSLKKCLENPLDHSTCKQLSFGRKSCAHLLVSASQSMMTVWSLLTCTAVWSVNISVSCLVMEPLSELMAAFTENKSLFVFRPDEAKPVYQKASVAEECVFYAAFIPHPSHKTDLPPQLQWQTKSQLYFMNKSQELLTIEENADDHISLKRPSTSVIAKNLPVDVFSMVIGKRRKVEEELEPMDTSVPNLAKNSSPLLMEMINTPTAVCAPVSSFSCQFLHSLMPRRDQSLMS